jgi:hypothetical protein
MLSALEDHSAVALTVVKKAESPLVLKKHSNSFPDIADREQNISLPFERTISTPL